jgi:demethoxyubiquinone hydroxylase (CLK1/Coq7/Cat5 family)
MGACSDWWQEEVERIVEQFRLDEISHKDALRELHRKGLDLQEARDLLNEAIA